MIELHENAISCFPPSFIVHAGFIYFNKKKQNHRLGLILEHNVTCSQDNKDLLTANSLGPFVASEFV